MPKIELDNAFLYPMPMVIVGVMVEGKPNFLAVGWVSRVNANPPMIAVALGRHHYTNQGILKERAFSVNIPNEPLMIKTDYCGLISGFKEDKSTLFEPFYGELKNAPMIKECPLCMECEVVESIDLPTNTLFIGTIKKAYAEEACLTNGKPDIKKVAPFMLTMPDNHYWTVGEKLGKAWCAGLEKNGK